MILWISFLLFPSGLSLSVFLPDISYGMSCHQLRPFYFPSQYHPMWSLWMSPHYCPIISHHITSHLESIFPLSDFSPGSYVCVSFMRFLLHLFQKHVFTQALFNSYPDDLYIPLPSLNLCDQCTSTEIIVAKIMFKISHQFLPFW